MLIYGICYYYKTNKVENIINHIKCFNNIKKGNDTFCLNIMIDSFDKKLYIEIENKFREFLQLNGILNYKILVDFNSGGTVLGLYNSFNYFKNNDQNDYIAFFEEDFTPLNDSWLKDSIDLLNTNKYIYIGEHTPSITNPEFNFDYKKKVLNDERVIENNKFDVVYKEYKLNIKDSVYTDGGYYFSTIKNFHEMELKIGRFHKGNMENQYSHSIDGIILGEVGFPSQVYLYFNFIGLNRENYFIHN